MGNKFVLLLILCSVWFCPAHLAGADEVVGYVRVDSYDTAPENAYELNRKGRKIVNLYQDMPVQNGDYIIPKMRGCVVLNFISHHCSSISVDSPTRVSCNSHDEQPGFWHGLYNSIFSSRYELEETEGTTTKESRKSEKHEGKKMDKW